MCQITLHIINPIVVKTRRHADAGCAIFRLFPSDTLIYGIPRDSSKNFNIHTCEHMILGQLRIGARQAKNAPLPLTAAFGCEFFCLDPIATDDRDKENNECRTG